MWTRKWLRLVRFLMQLKSYNSPAHITVGVDSGAGSITDGFLGASWGVLSSGEMTIDLISLSNTTTPAQGQEGLVEEDIITVDSHALPGIENKWFQCLIPQPCASYCLFWCPSFLHVTVWLLGSSHSQPVLLHFVLTATWPCKATHCLHMHTICISLWNLGERQF